MTTTSISWVASTNRDGTTTKGKTWNPTVGCTPVSAGCLNCYAATMAFRLAAMGHESYAGLAEMRGGRAVFTGKIKITDRLLAPLTWRKPAMIFVDSMSDLFHEAVPVETIDSVFGVMALAKQHTFQILTKRPERMLDYLVSSRRGEIEKERRTLADRGDNGLYWHDWPLPNVWVGASTENQEEYDRRIPFLAKCPATVRFLSCEPLLGPINLGEHALDLDWVIVGGESGRRARRMDLSWALSLRKQCDEAWIAFFFKQMGTVLTKEMGHRGKGDDMTLFPEVLRIQEFPAMEENLPV